jgi:hypothetical protein
LCHSGAEVCVILQWQNPEAIASVQLGIQQAGEGELHNMESFAQYAELEVED